MTTKPELSEFQRGNLERLARYLWDLPQAIFDMSHISQADDPCEHKCGAVGCAVGHGPTAGISALESESWIHYWDRCFTSSINLGDWLFGGTWESRDNTPRGAAKRILWTLRNGGTPSNYMKQLYGDAPLCYLDIELDQPLVTPATRLAFVDSALEPGRLAK